MNLATKQTIRKAILTWRSTLCKPRQQQLSSEIHHNFKLKFDEILAKSPDPRIAGYIELEKEVECLSLLRELEKLYPKATFYIPICNFNKEGK